ncbi:hypothetical protein SASPL_141487 [Salvia splendens]|uniref:GAG-pre-integrase domain-containing protein n=1 Tax=Salvia splendens TaxID=180675 RepID=A0A8X8WTR7_SALSN|nr:hypothetical protein SASPL_141487 [Salvia splendens]
MRSLLKQQGLWAPLTAKGKAKKADEKDEERVTLDEKAHSTIILCLSDDVIIEVGDQKTAAALWMKLESLYMTKSLTNTPEATSVPITHAGRYCKESGHWKYYCPKKKKKYGKKGDANGSTTVAEADDPNFEVSLALVADDQPHVWIFDLGASYHLCPHREYFTTYEQIDGGNITMANSDVCKVVGTGAIRKRTHDGVFCTLNDVRHVPQMTKNLISLSTFDSKGFNFKGEGGVMHIMKGLKVVLTALKHGTLYILKGSIVTGSADTASSEIQAESMTKLWHMRLGHMGKRGMQILSKRDFLSGNKVKNLDFYEHCVFGKLHRNQFPKKEVLGRSGNTACYLINRGPHTGIDCKTPYEVWSDTPADYSLLRVFGSTVYYHVSEGKLEPRAKKGVFVGYGEGVKGYRIWSLSENKVIHSRNVVFHENSMLNSVVKSVGAEESGSVDKQVELQVTHNESESQLQGGEDQHTTVESTGFDIHPEARQRRIAIDRARRTGVKPPQKYGF